MFIYKITDTTTSRCYIGMDTKPEYKQHRWKSHCKDALSGSDRKIHKAMRIAGIENCIYEVIERGFTSIAELALSEIEHIKENDSYRNGLNSTPGGDGLGIHDLSKFSSEDIQRIKNSLGEHWSIYNKKKWAGTSKEERVAMMVHLYTPDVIECRVATQKKYYETVEGAKEKHSAGLTRWAKENPEKKKENSIKNGLIGAEKISKQVILEKEDGTILRFKSRSEMQRETGQWFSTLLDKSNRGLYHNGYKLKEY